MVQEALHGCQEVIEELHGRQLPHVQYFKEKTKVHLDQEIIEVAEFINEQNQTTDELKK